MILEIKGNSLDDGPGIRSVVFFKGCPLNCSWCHNPESKSRRVELSFESALCVGCSSCIAVCPAAALDRANQGFVDRTRCRLCFACVEECPSGALSRVGQSLSVEEVAAKILRDKPYFDNSGGGVTLSGGEPTMEMEFCERLLKTLKSEGVHVLLESCGHFNYDLFAAKLLPHVDQIYMDIKIFDAAAHKQHCGQDNALILENFSKLVRAGVDILPRTPLVPGITDTEQNLNAIADFLLGLGVKSCGLLSYNPLWQSKCDQIGAAYAFAGSDEHQNWTPQEKRRACEEIFTSRGIRVV